MSLHLQIKIAGKELKLDVGMEKLSHIRLVCNNDTANLFKNNINSYETGEMFNHAISMIDNYVNTGLK